jgi:hypothetical protein
MKLTLAITNLLLFSYCFTQNINLGTLIGDSSSAVIYSNSRGQLQSNSLRNDFVNKFVFGGFIDEEIKNNSRERLTNKNIVNAEIYTSVGYIDLKNPISKKLGLFPMFEISAQAFGGATFTKDFYDLAMYGNEPNRTYDLGPSYAHHYINQSIQFGAMHKKSKSFLLLGITNGAQLYNWSAEKADFNTDQNSENLSLISNITGYQHFSKSSFFHSGGIGFKVDGQFNFSLNFKKDSSKLSLPFQLNIKDFGFTFWNSQTIKYDVYNSIDFDGLNLNVEGLVFDDLLPENAITESNSKTYSVLNGSIGLHKTINSSSRNIQLIAGVDIYFSKTVNPIGYLGMYCRPVRWIDFNVNIGYGGFGGVQDQIGLSFYAKENFKIKVFSNNTFSSLTNIGFGYSAGLTLIGSW